MTKYKVTVAIPCYNEADYIIHTISSVLNQSYYVDEIIICDDRSKNDLVQRVEKFINNKGFSHIKIYINKKNLGYQKNWNKCFERANNNYVVILHGDDLLKPDAIKKQIGFLKSHPEIALVGGMEDKIDEKGNAIKLLEPKGNVIFQKGKIYEFISNHGTYIPCSSVMFDMEKIKNVGFFEEDVMATDELYWPRVLNKYPIAILGESLIYRRNHPEQNEWKDFVNKPNEIVSAYYNFLNLENYEGRIQYKHKIKKLITKKFGRSLLGISILVIRFGQNNKIAIWYIGRALKIDPYLPIKNAIFWKSLIIILLNTTGLLTPLLKIRKKNLKTAQI